MFAVPVKATLRGPMVPRVSPKLLILRLGESVRLGWAGRLPSERPRLH